MSEDTESVDETRTDLRLDYTLMLGIVFILFAKVSGVFAFDIPMTAVYAIALAALFAATVTRH